MTTQPDAPLLPPPPSPPAGPSSRPSPGAPSQTQLVYAGVALVAALVLFGLGFVAGRTTAPDIPPGGAQAGEVYTPVTRADTPGERTRVDVENLARNWVTAYLTPGTADERAEALGPYSEAGAVNRWADDDGADLPPGQWCCQPALDLTQSGGTVVVPLSSGYRLRLEVSKEKDGGWVVYGMRVSG
jgi:hypothetical protein